MKKFTTRVRGVGPHVIEHNLGKRYVVVNTYDAKTHAPVWQKIKFLSTEQVEITFVDADPLQEMTTVGEDQEIEVVVMAVSEEKIKSEIFDSPSGATT